VGDVDLACPTFEASLKILDRLGVRLNLADCHERQGLTASAWAEFREAASWADKHSDARAAYARQRANALTSRLVKLQVSVPPTNQLPGLAVRRDGVAVPREAFGSPFPVNPGSYTEADEKQTKNGSSGRRCARGSEIRIGNSSTCAPSRRPASW
jgi:hypothetical protein